MNSLLKYNNTAETAIEQIKAENYTEKLSVFSGEILIVGISYDERKCQDASRVQ